MKAMKKITSLLIVLLMLLSMAACGGNNGGTVNNPDNPDEIVENTINEIPSNGVNKTKLLTSLNPLKSNVTTNL